MATKNIVPRATGEGSLGTADKKWAGVYANEVTVNGIALTSKLASIGSSVGGKVDTSTYNTKMTSLDSSISELSSGKVNKTEYAKEIGMVFAFAGATAPSGYLFCDGSALSRTDYKKLFDVIGTSYGVGDGSTTFNLPNLVDKFIQGNATVGSVKSAGLPNIIGWFETRKTNYDDGMTTLVQRGLPNAFTNNADGYNTLDTVVQNNGAAKTTEMKFSASDYSNIYGNSSTVQPPAVTMQYIIRYE